MEYHYKMKPLYKIFFGVVFGGFALLIISVIYEEIKAGYIPFYFIFGLLLILYAFIISTRKEIILSEDWIESIQLKRTRMLFKEIDEVVLERGKIEVYGNSQNIEIPTHLENFEDLRTRLLKKTAPKVVKGNTFKGEIQF